MIALLIRSALMTSSDCSSHQIRPLYLKLWTWHTALRPEKAYVVASGAGWWLELLGLYAGALACMLIALPICT